VLHRLLIHLLGLAGLLGCGLSLIGLGLLLYIRVKLVLQGAPGVAGLDTPGCALFVLDAFKEPGTTFLLSALVFVLCEVALRSTHRPLPREDHEPDSISS
jgi:hypothetical protein